MEPSVLVHGPFDILQSRLIVVLRSGHPSSGPSQAKDHPFAADRADSGCAQLFHIVPGGFINIRYLAERALDLLGLFRLLQHIDVVHQQLLELRQGIIGCPGFRQCRLQVLGKGQTVDQLHDGQSFLLVLGSGHQLGVVPPGLL